MFILKRQDVEISSIQHPKRDRQIPILTYQGQTFRLINVFSATQEEEAKAHWRDLTDNQGKACVLLEEPERYSIWGRIRMERIAEGTPVDVKIVPLTQACLLLLQSIALDIEDLLGTRQAALFQKDLLAVFQQSHFPQASSKEAVNHLLTIDALGSLQLPAWEEHHLVTLLQELHQLGKQYLGNVTFAEGIETTLQDMPEGEREEFMSWIERSPLGKLWHA